jgi:hypothetical protein
MAYGHRYIIKQILRDGNFLVVNIYEKNYVGTDIKSYDAISISLEPNSSDDEPLPTILSSQLNINFNISTDNDYLNLPDLLSFDDRRYYVELVKSTYYDNVIWAGYLFNDYVNIPFTTGNNTVTMVAIDGLSFLRYEIYKLNGIEDQNGTIKYIDLIAEALNIINFPNNIRLKIVCSYFAEGMLDRGDEQYYDAFQQTYQYRRDFLQLDYYTILENIIKSFGCRMFQSNGSWNIVSINEMAAANRYFTIYNISPTVSIVSGGIDYEYFSIEPYAENNIHFIDNSQTKISRKGYPTLIMEGSIDRPINYCHNGDLKQLNAGLPVGWRLVHTGSAGHAYFIEEAEDQFNYVDLFAGNFPTFGTATFESGVTLPLKTYLPYMISPSVDVSFKFRIINSGGKIEIKIILTSGTVYYWNNTTKEWQTTATFISVQSATIFQWTTFSVSLETGSVLIPSGVNMEGYVSLKFIADNTHTFIQVGDIKIDQKAKAVTAIQVTRSIGVESSITKEISQEYGNFIPNTSNNNKGLLVDSSGVFLKNWYRYGKTGIYLILINLIARQFSNLIGKNFATLEGSLGKTLYNDDLIYLEYPFAIEDSTVSPMSYNGIRFIANRMSVIPQEDVIDSLQLIEVTDTDNASTEKIEYIGDATMVIPRRYF